MELTRGETLELEIEVSEEAEVYVEFSGPEERRVKATKNGNKFRVIADTEEWKSGDYVWEFWVVKNQIKRVVQRNYLTLRPSAKELGPDPIITARKAVAYIKEMLSAAPTLEAKKYKINNRELERYGIDELLKLLDFWCKELKRLERKADGVSPLGPHIEFYI
jgi:hypothetical protein